MIPTGTEVVVYRNLNRRDGNGGPVWSVATATRTGGKGKLLGYVAGSVGLSLINARPYVSGRAPAVAAGPREVCAWVVGTVAAGMLPATVGVTYDRHAMRFVNRAGGSAWTGSAVATFTDAMRVS